jgi:hypothetical protein
MRFVVGWADAARTPRNGYKYKSLRAPKNGVA